MTNAVYFHGTWEQPFKAEFTEAAPFFAPAKTREVPLMNTMGAFPYVKRAGVQAIELPYVGEAVSLLVLLPEKADGARGKFEQAFSVGFIGELRESLRPQLALVYLPRFRMEPKYNMTDALARLGIGKAMSPAEADFSDIVDGPLYIDEVLHHAYVDVDEQGTEAVAATAMSGGFGSITRLPEPVVFRADRPFVFAIIDRRTEAILFLGRLTDPPRGE